MPQLLATATAPGSAARGLIYLALVLAVWAAVYALGCAFWPFRACRRCSGLGRRPSPSGRAFRLCPRCGGTGRRLRAGRWVWNLIQRTRRGAS